MIQLREDIAWVRFDDGRLLPFDTERLTESIEHAGEFAGHCDRLLAESVASAVCLYAAGKTVDASEIAQIVSDVLTMLGFNAVARAYSLRHEWREIRLDQIPGFELEFYRQLDLALRDATGAEEMAKVQLRGLRACVMRLRGARRWCAGCRQLAEDIVSFVRGRSAQVRSADAVALCLEVRE